MRHIRCTHHSSQIEGCIMSVPLRETVDPDHLPLAKLFKRFTSDLQTLVRQEIALATAQLTRAVGKLSTSVLTMVAGGVVLFAGFLTLLAAAVLGLALIVQPWLAALIVSAVVIV